MNKNFKIIFSLLIPVFVCALFLSSQVQAQIKLQEEMPEEKSYYYESVKVNIQINKDATFDVAETIAYNFDGNFDYVYLNISNKGLGRIDNVYVVDEGTGKRLQKVPALDNLDNTKYSSPEEYWVEGDKITWTFDLKENKNRTWTIHYKVYDGIPLFEYCKENDELHWNVLSKSKAEKINKVEVFVKLPKSQNINEMAVKLETSDDVKNTKSKVLNSQTFYFSGEDLLPNSEFKITAGWPKGMLNRNLILFLFSFVNWGEIVYYLILFTVSLILIFAFAGKELRDWSKTPVFIEYKPHKDVSYKDMSAHINDKMVSNKDLPKNIAGLAVKGFQEIDGFQKEYLKSRELISEKAFLILFIAVCLVSSSLLALVIISPYCSSLLASSILNSASTKFIITVFSVLLPIIIFATMFSIWRKYGRDIKAGTIIPQYEPPKGITPAIADYIYHEKTSNKSFPSVILDMAIEGFIKMEDVREQHEKIDIVKFPKSIAIVLLFIITLIVFSFYEIEYFLVYLFLVVPFIVFIFLFVKAKINESYNSNFSKDIELTYNKHNLTDEKLYSLVSFVIYILFKDKKSVKLKELKAENNLGGRNINFQFEKGFMEIKKYLEVIPSHFYNEHYKSLKAYKIIAAFSICVFFIFFFLFLFGLLFFSDDLIGVLMWYLNLIFTNGFFLSLFVSFIIAMIFDCFMPSRTKEGMEIYKHLLGFKMYLEKAEKFRVRECVPETFEKYLPYAVIFGIEKKWRNRFSGIINMEENQKY